MTGSACGEALRYKQLISPLVSWTEFVRLWPYLGEVAGIPGARIPSSLLDTAPAVATLRERISFSKIHDNVEQGKLAAAGVVTTASSTALSVVFHAGGGKPPRDRRRGIDYVPTQLTADHVHASTAFPIVFPAISLSPNGEQGWYFDGGTRLNTPLKPVLALGAERLIVIALNSLTPRRPARDERPPDVVDGATQLFQGLLIDPVINDLYNLAGVNQMLLDDSEQTMSAHERRTKRRHVPYMLIAPEDPDAIGRLAAETYREHYASPRGALRSPNAATLGRLVDAGASATHGELVSLLFYVPEFIKQLIALGRQDAERWLAQSHDLGRWQLGPIPV